ncbi:MAG: ABC transporter ATP-binding protein [bacterium]|jgi:lipopolysaccharide transport system ATP-binding protein|nr:ABC transporter ATP-binding protein [bacterium]
MNPTAKPPAIICQGVGKTYFLSEERATSLKEKILRGGRGRQTQRVIEALKSIDLTIAQGEILGLIGNNGSGKSTLLKLIAGITKPTHGAITVSGTVASMLEVGVGFHPEMTGRENVFLSGALLGIPRQELEKRIPEITAFSELGHFIDAPVKHYSSGMYLRLGFAIGIFVQPDILLVDEILAVGDHRFQQKCKGHIRELRNSGKTILLVSHDLDAILGLCSRAVVLKSGTIAGEGHPYEMINLYKQHQFELARQRQEVISPEIIKRNRKGTFELRFDRIRMMNHEGQERYVFETGEPVRVELEWTAKQPIPYPVFGLGVMDDSGNPLYIAATDVTFGDIECVQGQGKTVFELESLPLLDGAYSLSVSVAQREDGPGSAFNLYEGFDFCDQLCPFFVRPGQKGYGLRGTVYIPCKATITSEADRYTP